MRSKSQVLRQHSRGGASHAQGALKLGVPHAPSAFTEAELHVIAAALTAHRKIIMGLLGRMTKRDYTEQPDLVALREHHIGLVDAALAKTQTKLTGV